MGKDNDKVKEAEANFFGEDLDWNDDESQEIAKTAEADRPTKAALAEPIAPPPPPPFVPNRAARRPPMPTLPPTPSMLAALEDDPVAPGTGEDATESIDKPVAPVGTTTIVAPEADLDAEMPMPLGLPLAAPPPSSSFGAVKLTERAPGEAAPSQDALPTVLDPQRGRLLDEHDLLGPDMPTQEDSTLDVDPDSEPHDGGNRLPPAPQVQADWDSGSVDELPIEPAFPRENTEDAAFADTLDEQDDVPLVRTHEPAPARASAPSFEGTASFSPPVRRDSLDADLTGAVPNPRPSEPWTPRGDEQDWRDIVRALVGEAAAQTAGTRGRLLYEAGRITERRLGDRAGAEALFRDALASGAEFAELHEELANTASLAQRWSEASLQYVALANTSSGAEAAEAWEHAAVVYRQRLGRSDEAVTFLERAIQADTNGYAAWCQYRDALVELGRDEDRARVLGRLAELAGGQLAADAWWEQGRVYQRLERIPEAIESLQRARAADPAHGATFLALEALYLQVGDHKKRAELYAAEADRAANPQDQAAFSVRAAGAWQRAGDLAAAEIALRLAVTAGSPVARRELLALLEGAGRLEALAEAIWHEREAQTPAERVHHSLRLAEVRQRLGDTRGAVEMYRDALTADAHATPAWFGLFGSWIAEGPWADVASVLAARPWTLALTAEARGELGDAETAWAALLPNAAAFEALARLQRRRAAWDDVAAAWEARANAALNPTEKAAWWLLAAGAGPRTPATRLRLEAAFRAAPELEAATAGYLASAEDEGGVVLAEALESLASRSPHYAARSAAAWLAVGDLAKATTQVLAALQGDPNQPLALEILDQLAARKHADPELLLAFLARAERSEGSERLWRRLACATLAAANPGREGRPHAMAVLAEDPGHLSALSWLSWPEDDATTLLWRKVIGAQSEPAARQAFRLRLAEITADRGDGTTARALLTDLTNETEGVAHRAASRLAEALSAWDLAALLLAPSTAPEDQLHRARLVGHRLAEARAAVGIYRELLDDPVWGLAAAAGAAGMAQRAGDVPMVLRANALLADRSESVPVRAAYAAWTAGLLEVQDRVDDAEGYWKIALEGRPSSRAAFAGVHRGLVARADAEGLRALYAAYQPNEKVALARSLDDASDYPGALAAWEAALEAGAPPVIALLAIERLQMRLQDWAGAYDALSRRHKLTADDDTKAAIDAKRRWLLAEKLASTDMAWDLYRQLHDEQPGDRDITENLARIAAARGLVAQSILYLKELADSSADRVDAARTQRRIAEVYEKSGDVASARQAYLDALDHVPDDADSLSGLRRLAEVNEDWLGLVAVLQREGGLVTGARKADVRRDIARVQEQKIGDRAVAMDSWRAVLELAPQDPEALGRLVALSAEFGEWSQFVESGHAMVPLLSGDEKVTLLRRMGIACQELARDDAAKFFEAAIAETPPDVESAKRLEALYRGRGDWLGALRAYSILAEHDAPETHRDWLEKAARTELDGRRDRPAAAVWYDRILAIDPDNAGALKFQAEYLFSGERGDAALPVYERLQAYMESTQDIDDFDTRMELSSYYFRFAELLGEAGRNDEALARYERALELNPAHLPSLNAVGPIYTGRQDWKNAERVYRQILQLTGGQGEKEQVANIYTELGVVELALGTPDKAQKRFAKALDLSPNHVGALKGLARILEDREDWANLFNVYNNLIYHAPQVEDVVGAYLVKGRILDERMNRPDKAVQHYEGVLKIDPGHAVARIRIAELHLRRDDGGKDALEAVEGALDAATGARRADLLGLGALAKLLLNDEPGAQAMAELAHATDPTLVVDLTDFDGARDHIKGRVTI